jgi:uncharacterized protein YndB with AHSA1/START domain
MVSDRIEKKIILHAPLEKVWQAIADSEQFGFWFGVALEGPFVAGASVYAQMAQTKVDPEVAKLQQPSDGKAFEFFVERIVPMHKIALRWHPYAVDPDIDYTKEPMTLIEFNLKEVAEGVLLTICESGFDEIPIERRAKAFEANNGGWAMQAQLIEKYLEKRYSRS